MKLDLSEITLWSTVWSRDPNLLMRTLRVMRYCNRIAEFHETILFSCIPIVEDGFRVIPIGELNPTTFNVFVNRETPSYFEGNFAMSVHEDGFPTHPNLWNPKFIEYDYIGAPWPDRVVGNGGLSIESRRLFTQKLNLPFPATNTSWSEHGVETSKSLPSDCFICRTHREELERNGILFAPFDLAESFSVEQTGHDRSSFGFHGRSAVPRRYAEGWKLIENSER